MVHAYKNGGYNIVLDVNSGSVHVVDDVVYDLVPVVEKMLVSYHGTAAAIDTDKEGDEDFQKLFNEVSAMSEISSGYSSEDIGEAISEILELRASEVLYTDDVYENYVDDFQNRDTVVKALCLNIAHDCNLRCKYCFADEGEY
ncbi:MAG: thioether cross-link-forming SCIFF peptide maturase, partial [Butyrivibrio sp.]|nr:thioether cross-link-forming SCIFF peptide maturase [Butyrivibrio sp.]